ncbi:MAG: hypothetical protein FWE27_08500 [Defluviitaleaceae bacterium]|nr:hypothetical protein [Defluviitaleaceae bacterium]
MKTSTRFDEDKFDLDAHKRAADVVKREKARDNRIRNQVKRGKIIVAVVTIVIFFILFYIAAELGLMQIF